MIEPGQLRQFFEPGGALSRVHPGFEHRHGQADMAERVASTLRDGGTLMVEAGTGTGKTLAYLVPAVLADRRVIVSTGTRNLQDQIQRHDLPFIRRELELDFEATVMKGRDNYLCRFRLAGFLREPLLEVLDERRWLPRIESWAGSTQQGDRAELSELPDSLRMWREINARADTCSGRKCPEYDACWLTRLKREAEGSRVVVVNHHLFFADLALRSAYGSVLPDYDTVVFDEAHLLEETATMYFGRQVGSGQLEELAKDAERLAARSGGLGRSGGGAALLRAAADEFFAPLRGRMRGSVGRIGFDPPGRGGIDLEAEWAVLSEALDDVGRQADDEDEESGETLRQRAEQLRETLDQVLERDDPAFVYGVETRGRGGIVLSAAPIDVSELLRETLFERLHATVLTSATLTVEKKFDFFRSRLGLDAAEAIEVDSTFDHANQAALYLPRDMPDPRSADFVERAAGRINELAEITSGRGFVLFTSYANLHGVRDRLAAEGRWPLLVQGEGSKAALVDRFKQSEGALLLGTTAFWHGVDVVGRALSLVVIDKLPFDVPSDPLVSARIDRIRREGGNPFREYQLPLAVLELKQGLGRLLRSGSDHGLLAVLDPRLGSKPYGKVFLRSLPPYTTVSDLEACRRFFGEE